MACQPDCIAVCDLEHFASTPLPKLMDKVEELGHDPMNHWWRDLLRCRSCGQLYFHEFFERIDWENGADPQHHVFIPVSGRAQALPFGAMPPGSVRPDRRHLRKDWPSDRPRPFAYWQDQG